MPQPYLAFYVRDWRSDAALHACSLSARGLWIEMMTFMHEAEPYGHLIVGGRPIGERDHAFLALQVGAKESDVRRMLAELKAAGVYSVSESGTIVSRRMLRDAEKRARDQENGRKGGRPRKTQGVSENETQGFDKEKPTASSAEHESKSPCAREAGARDRVLSSQTQSQPGEIEPLSRVPGDDDAASKRDDLLLDDDEDLGGGFARRNGDPAAMRAADEFGAWFYREGTRLRGIDSHELYPGSLGQRDLVPAMNLLAHYPLDEIKARAVAMFTWAADERDPMRMPATIATLEREWRRFRPRAKDVSDDKPDEIALQLRSMVRG